MLGIWFQYSSHCHFKLKPTLTVWLHGYFFSYPNLTAWYKEQERHGNSWRWQHRTEGTGGLLWMAYAPGGSNRLKKMNKDSNAFERKVSMYPKSTLTQVSFLSTSTKMRCVAVRYNVPTVLFLVLCLSNNRTFSTCKHKTDWLIDWLIDCMIDLTD